MARDEWDGRPKLGASGADRGDAGVEAYEPPHLQVIGTVAEITQGIVPITTDGLAPGSALSF
jgi:hypothetical protein